MRFGKKGVPMLSLNLGALPGAIWLDEKQARTVSRFRVVRASDGAPLAYCQGIDDAAKWVRSFGVPCRILTRNGREVSHE
jgi:hypothetical protein